MTTDYRFSKLSGEMQTRNINLLENAFIRKGFNIETLNNTPDWKVLNAYELMMRKTQGLFNSSVWIDFILC